MSRVIMISDIHGCMEQFEQLINALELDSDKDKLILLGDYVDRGPNSKEVVDKVMSLVEEYGAIALRGNHDQRLVDLIRNRDETIESKFILHGGIDTINSYCDHDNKDSTLDLNTAISIIGKNYSHHIAFLSNLPLYYEDDHHIYVHAGLNPTYTNWKEQTDHDFMYIKYEFINNPTVVNKKVVFGHTKAIDIHDQPDVWFGDGKIGIDGGCAYGLQLNGLIFKEGHYDTIRISNRSK